MSERPGRALTVVVPTQDRPRLLMRALDYYRGLGLHVVVADGSGQPCREAADRPDVDYLHLPGASPWARMARAVERVATPYCVASPDDDFLLPVGLDLCVRALESNADCVSAQGIYCEYRIAERTRMDVKLKYVSAYRQQMLALPAARGAVDRVERLMDHFVQYVWAVHRTEHLALVIRLAGGAGPLALELVELLFSLVSAGRGDCAVVPALYCLRDVTPSRVPDKDKAFTFVLSRDPGKQGSYRALLGLVCGAIGADLAAVQESSRVRPDAARMEDWLDAVLRQWALQAAAPAVHPAPTITPRPFRDEDSGIHGSFEPAAVLGDVDTGPEALYPALRLVQRDFRPEECFHVRFGRPATAPRRGAVRWLARRLGLSVNP